MKPRIAVTVNPGEASDPAARKKYRDAVTAAGGEPVLVDTTGGSTVAEMLAAFDGLLLPGGTDVDPTAYGGRSHPSVDVADPRRDSLELEAARFARRSGLPTLAICRGMQVVNVALGGTLFEDIPDQYEPSNGLRLRHQQTPDFGRHETTHEVDVKSGSKLAGIAGAAAIRVNSLHHQSVRRIAHGLEPVAHARDGIVEAFELRSEHPFFVGVQWHPEELVGADEPSRRLFASFVAAAARRAAAKPLATGRG
ncbi:MAG TPA: gamma-glutamyl-gamma-aminobutyrate hydrolase family protein [Candidatus Eremiobacteraceae bacterium]|nr:gamma-glutamyl-gamma-aminobutyrate hydrolase family protein [Candidatus Eremiobacteraceae bacterium]